MSRTSCTRRSAVGAAGPNLNINCLIPGVPHPDRDMAPRHLVAHQLHQALRARRREIAQLAEPARARRPALELPFAAQAQLPH